MSLQHQRIPFPIKTLRSHYFLCNYKPYTYGKDELSRSLLRFKSANQLDVQAWVECSVKALSNIITDKFIIVRALHGEELIPSNSSLDHLGNKLKQAFHCHYQPELIRKSKRTQSLKFLRKEDRQAELKDAYMFTDTADFTSKSFLIIDDILTTGSTLHSIENAIVKNTGNNDIIYYTLAHSNYTSELNQNVSLIGESYSWQKSQGWSVSEDNAHYGTLDALKTKIDTNFDYPIIKRSNPMRR